MLTKQEIEAIVNYVPGPCNCVDVIGDNECIHCVNAREFMQLSKRLATDVLAFFRNKGWYGG